MLLPLNDEEAQVLINMVNIAVQAKGLEAAEAGLLFLKKIQVAQAAEKEEAIVAARKAREDAAKPKPEPEAKQDFPLDLAPAEKAGGTD
jgi:hypothetical protein